MIRRSIIFAAFAFSSYCFANQGVNTNPDFNRMQDNAPPPQFQNQSVPQNFSPADDETSTNSKFEADSPEANVSISQPAKPGDTIFDIKTTHGSVIIKKLPAEPKETKDKVTTDTQKKPDTKPIQPNITKKPQS